MPEPESLNLLQMLVLAVVQGATEFIPVSSSGHLVLVREVLGWSDEHGVVVDVLLHVASLGAVLLYFWRDWLNLFRVYTGKPVDENADFYRRLPLYLIVATVPLVLFGPLIAPHMESVRDANIVAMIMMGTAAWFILAERVRPPAGEIGLKSSVAMGLIQVIALLPGASRSGLTTGAGMMMGLERATAAKFAFFMVLPAIGGAIVYEIPEILKAEAAGLNFGLLGVGFAACLIVSLACIHFCLTFFRRHSLVVFSIYLFVLGGVLLLYGRIA